MATMASTTDLLGADGSADPTPPPPYKRDPDAADQNGPAGQNGEKKGDGGKQVDPKVSYFKLLFRFADAWDNLLMVCGLLSAVATGITLPLMTIPFGNMVDVFGDYAKGGSKDEFDDGIAYNALFFVVLGCVNLVTGFGQVFFLLLSGERMSRKLRNAYVRAIFRQDIGWHDAQKTGGLVSRIASDTFSVQEGIGEKIGSFVQFITTFVGGFVIGFVRGWRIAAVLLAVVPILAACGAFMAKYMASMSEEGSDAYAAAGAVAAEAISSVRTVAAFGGENRESKRYDAALQDARKVGVKKGVVQGAMMGSVFFVMYCGYALAFYYGGVLVANGTMTGGAVLSAFFAVIIGAFSLGNAGPPGMSFSTAAGAGYRIFAVLDRHTAVDALSGEGERPAEAVRGEIELEGVSFSYPTRPDVPVLQNLSLRLEAGKRTALVGHSGSGKSTIVGLIERFYDPQAGAVRLDGRDVRSLNVHWLRKQCGLVSQEPVLFDMTIEENIMLGGDNVTHEQVVAAAKAANIHDFIMQLPSKYDTRVGEKGAQLSGGQKQRVAIARALVRNPPIMLLDEATSALDTESEGIVQAALDSASTGRTTVVIAHRLSTVQSADRIIVMGQGRVLEQGTHVSLMADASSHYRALVERQWLNHGVEESASSERQSASATQGAAPQAPNGAGIEGDRKSSKTAGIAGQPARGQDDEAEPKDAKEAVYHVPLRRLAELSSPEWKWLAIGAISSIVNGLVMPLFSIIFSEMLGVFNGSDSSQIKKDASFWAGMFLVLAVVTFLCNWGLVSAFAISGEWLTQRLRQMSFDKILRKDMAFFDFPENSTGVLTTRLAVDATLVQGLFGSRLGNLTTMVVTALAGLIIALEASWQLTLVVLATVPLVIVGGALQMQALTGHAAGSKRAYETAGAVASEAITNMRTVQGLSIEEHFLAKYSVATKEPFKRGRRQGFVAGLGFGGSQAVLYYVDALAFWYGAQLVADGKIDFVELMTAFMAIIFCAMMLGQMSSFAPDVGKARVAASHIFRLLDSSSAIDPLSRDGAVLPGAPAGRIKFDNVTFGYPTRPDITVLRGMGLEAEPGQTVAIVGASGSGKSTVILLLERFYNQAGGSIVLDGQNIRDINVRNLRSHMGLVGQEPVLFGSSIADNIAYGAADDSVPVTREAVEEAARQANIHTFIASLPNGYDTLVGERGAQLSGGQKQRIAIARALLRNPRILLLDEATSALDSESEKIVQDALNRARSGRTTLVVAHRLATVQDADKIVVVQRGQVVEVGTHRSLLELNGVYAQLASRQFAE